MATMKLLIVAFLAFLVFVDGHAVMNMVANKGLGDGHKAVEREGLVKEESGNMTKRLERETNAKELGRETNAKELDRETNAVNDRLKNAKKSSQGAFKRDEEKRGNKKKKKETKRKTKEKKPEKETKKQRTKKYGTKDVKRRSRKKKEAKKAKRKGKGKEKIVHRRKKQKKPGKVRADQRRDGNCLSSTTCVDIAMSRFQLFNSKVFNFQRQAKRILAKRSIGKKKSSKSGAFKASIFHLIEIGGNMSNPACSGSFDNKGAKQIKNLSATLSKCEENITALCDPSNMPKVNFTLLDLCNRSMNMFAAFVEKCSALSGNKACSCWRGNNNSTREMISSVQRCDLGDLPKRTRFALDDCKSAFGNCRKFQDDVASTQFACSQDPDVLKKKLKNLVQNREAVAKVQTKISSLIKRNSSRVKRQDASTAPGFISLCLKVTKLVAETPNSYQIFVDSSLIITSDPTELSSNDLTSLLTVTTKLTIAIAVLDQEISVAVSTIYGI